MNAVNSNQYDEISDDKIPGFAITAELPTTKFLTTKFLATKFPPPIWKILSKKKASLLESLKSKHLYVIFDGTKNRQIQSDSDILVGVMNSPPNSASDQ